MSKWQSVTSKQPCPICTRVSRCTRSADGKEVRCRRQMGIVPDWYMTNILDGRIAVYRRKNRKSHTVTVTITINDKWLYGLPSAAIPICWEDVFDVAIR